MEHSNELESRHKSGIYALKILEVRRDGAIVKNPLNPKTCVLVPLSGSDYFEAGIYVDVEFIKTGKYSFKFNLVGVTPSEFLPANGALIF